MPIQRINFTSSLLPNQQTQTQTAKDVDNKPVSDPQPPKANEAAEVITEEKPDHTVRNWSIGLGAAATLISLGVAGRKGYLGNGLQKLLGGAKKETSHIADDAAEGASHLKPNNQTTNETTHIADDTAESASNLKPNNQTTNEAAETLSETTARETKADPIITEPQPTPKAGTGKPLKPGVKSVNGQITKAEIEAIEATLDKTMPKITDDLLSIDVSKIPQDGSGYQKLIFDTFKIPKTGDKTVQIFHEGKQINAFYYDGKLSAVHIDNAGRDPVYINLNSDHTISSVRDGSMFVNYYLNKPNSISVAHPSYEYWYNTDGKLDHIFQNNSANEPIKYIKYHPGTKNVERVDYYKIQGVYRSIKTEYYDNGKLDKETYFGKDGASILRY